MAFENVGVLVGRVWSPSGGLVKHGEVFLNNVSGDHELQIADLDFHPHPHAEIDDDGEFLLIFRWDAADIGEAASPINLAIYVTQDVDNPGVPHGNTIASTRTNVRGYLIRNWGQVMRDMSQMPSNLSGMVKLGEKVYRAFRRIPRLRLFTGVTRMSSEQWAIVAGDDAIFLR